MDEPTAMKVATADLRIIRRRVDMVLADLYESAPGYAGEVESVRDAIDNAVRVLNGESPE